MQRQRVQEVLQVVDVLLHIRRERSRAVVTEAVTQERRLVVDHVIAILPGIHEVDVAVHHALEPNRGRQRRLATLAVAREDAPQRIGVVRTLHGKVEFHFTQGGVVRKVRKARATGQRCRELLRQPLR